MERSIDCIVEASKCPLSIVIVGVGKADFNDMVRQVVNIQAQYLKRTIQKSWLDHIQWCSYLC